MGKASGFQVGLAALSIMCAGVLNASASSAERSTISRFTDDCEIVALVGKQFMGWSAAKPFMFYPRAEGDESHDYLGQCPWQSIGIDAADIGDANSENAFSIEDIKYDGPWAFVNLYRREGLLGKVEFAESDMCFVEKMHGSWHIQKCEMTAIS